MIPASCKHFVVSTDDLWDLQIKTTDSLGNRSIEYGTFCKDCAEKLLNDNLVIRSRKDELEWITGTPIAHHDSIMEIAVANIDSHDPVIRRLATYVVESEIVKSKPAYEIQIDTGSYFTLSIADQTIDGVGTVMSCNSVDDAIIALDGARITKVRELKLVNADGEYWIDANDTNHYRYFIEQCRNAAMSLLDFPGKTFIYEDALVAIKVIPVNP